MTAFSEAWNLLKAIDDDGNTICPKCGKKVPYGDESAAIDSTGECFDCGDKSMREWEEQQSNDFPAQLSVHEQEQLDRGG